MAIEIVVKYDATNKVYKAYEPTTDTLFMTESLGETFLKLSEFLQQRGMIVGDLLSSQDITYHIDSPTFVAMVQSNAALLKRLDTTPTGFMMSSKKLATSLQQQPNNSSSSSRKDKWSKRMGSGSFSKSSFNESSRKFGNR